MAEESAKEVSGMEVETLSAADQADGDAAENGGDLNSKRPREEEEAAAAEEEENGGSKKQRVDKSVEEERLEKKLEGGEGDDGDEEEGEKDPGSEGEKDPVSGPVNVGPKSFGSSVEMFDYFYKFLHFWPPNLNVNKYEHMVLLDLLEKGHLEPEKKIGSGVDAFQVRFHPQFKSRCFFIVRNDESVDDFSFRKCVDHILPLPENMQAKYDVNKALGGGRGGGYGGKGGGGGRGGGRGRGHGHGRGRGRGGKFRN